MKEGVTEECVWPWDAGKGKAMGMALETPGEKADMPGL